MKAEDLAERLSWLIQPEDSSTWEECRPKERLWRHREAAPVLAVVKFLIWYLVAVFGGLLLAGLH